MSNSTINSTVIVPYTDLNRVLAGELFYQHIGLTLEAAEPSKRKCSGFTLRSALGQ